VEYYRGHEPTPKPTNGSIELVWRHLLTSFLQSTSKVGFGSLTAIKGKPKNMFSRQLDAEIHIARKIFAAARNLPAAASAVETSAFYSESFGLA